MKKITLILAVGLFAGLASCSDPKTVIDTTKEAMNFPTAEIGEGYALNAQHCSKCHGLKTVKNYTREQWDKILPAMAKKAGITSEQEAKIDAYINWELKR